MDIPTPDGEVSHKDWKGSIAEDESESPDDELRETTNTLPPATGASSVATLETSPQPQGWLCSIRTRDERTELMSKHSAEIHVSEFL